MGRNISTEEGSPIPPRDRDIAFERSTNFLVPYNRANVNRCRCPQCPVQDDSQCAQDKFKSSKQLMENLPEGEVPDPEDFPGVYCSEGEATSLLSQRQSNLSFCLQTVVFSLTHCRFCFLTCFFKNFPNFCASDLFSA